MLGLRLSNLMKMFSALMFCILFSNSANATRACFLLGSGLCHAACVGIDEGALPDIDNASGNEKVCALALAKDVATVRWLVEHGVNVNSQKSSVNTNSPAGRTALFKVIFERRHDIFQALLREGIDVNIADSKGTTPLMYAVSAGQLQMVKELLESKASVTLKDRQGREALCHADVYLITPHREEIKDLLKSYNAVCSK